MSFLHQQRDRDRDSERQRQRERVSNLLQTLNHTFMPKSAYLSQCRIVVYPSFHRNFYLTQILPAPEIPSSSKQNKILVFKI